MRAKAIGVISSLLCHVTFAAGLIGPPVNPDIGISKSYGVEYSYSDLDLLYDAPVGSANPQLQTMLGRLGLSLTKSQMIYATFGGATYTDAPDYAGPGFSWGLTHKYSTPLSEGLTGSVTSKVMWIRAGDSSLGRDYSFQEVIVAPGVAWQSGDTSLYGGVIARFIDGHSSLADVDDELKPGIYLGLSLDYLDPTNPDMRFFKAATVVIEGQLTEDQSSVSVGLEWQL